MVAICYSGTFELSMCTRGYIVAVEIFVHFARKLVKAVQRQRQIP